MRWSRVGLLIALLSPVLVAGPVPTALADETCNSPYMGNLIKGQEDYVYVWTLTLRLESSSRPN